MFYEMDKSTMYITIYESYDDQDIYCSVYAYSLGAIFKKSGSL